MAQTTTALSAKDVVIKVNETDISGSSNRVEITPVRAMGTTHSFDGDFNIVVPGKQSVTGSIRAIYTETAAEAETTLWTLYNGATKGTLYVAGKGTGTSANWTWTVEFYLSQAPLVFDGTTADPTLVDFNFTGTGELTKGTVGA